MDEGGAAWFDPEIAGCHFAAERLKGRFRKLITPLGRAVGQSIPLVCQDWPTRRRPIAFSPMAESARPMFRPDIFNQPASAWEPPIA